MYTVSIDVPPVCVKQISEGIVEHYRKEEDTEGLKNTKLPKKFAADYYQKEIARDGARYIFDHFVRHAIFDALSSNKMTSINQPSVNGVTGSLKKGFTYSFTICTMPQRDVKSWKKIGFKPAQRKRYSDLDDQAREFLSQERAKLLTPRVEAYDWIVFTAHHTGINPQSFPHTAYPYYLLFPVLPHSTPVSSAIAHALHRGEKTAVLREHSLFNEQSIASDVSYVTFENIQRIAVGSDITTALVSFFNLKSELDVHELIIEFFSTLNDLPLRKALYADLLHALRKAFRCEISLHAITRRKEMLLRSLQQSPENKVYLKTPGFTKHLSELAEQQIQEEFLIDMVAQQENIEPTAEEIAAYLHIISHEKARALIYFTPQLTNSQLHAPVSHEPIIEAVRREKTLNMMLNSFR